MENSPEQRDQKSLPDVLKSQAALFDADGSIWREVSEALKNHFSHIVALRGAGSYNGMDPVEEKKILEAELLPRLTSLIASGPTAILFDGDADDPEHPDIGSVIGRLRDAFADQKSEQLLFLTAQRKDWYEPSGPGKNLANIRGLEYQTVVFDQGKYPGEHSHFTQSVDLVRHPGYEQWYIGASGAIAEEQLRDYNDKVPTGGQRKVTLFRVPNNPEINDSIRGRLVKAQESGDQEAVRRYEDSLRRREKRFGVHWTSDGTPNIDTQVFSSLEINYVGTRYDNFFE